MMVGILPLGSPFEVTPLLSWIWGSLHTPVGLSEEFGWKGIKNGNTLYSTFFIEYSPPPYLFCGFLCLLLEIDMGLLQLIAEAEGDYDQKQQQQLKQPGQNWSFCVWGLPASFHLSLFPYYSTTRPLSWPFCLPSLPQSIHCFCLVLLHPAHPFLLHETLG